MVGKQRNFGLDVMRSTSILMVVLAHKFTFNYEFGLVGVQIFFILSGFLIGQILIRDFKKKIDISTVVKFWKRRWYRTLPLYYLILLLKVVVYGNPFGWKIIVYFLFLQANFVGISFFGVSWSLVVEEWFYILLPIVSFVFLGKTFKASRYWKILLGTILIVFLARLLWNALQKGIIIYQFDCLLVGVVLALLKLEYAKIYAELDKVWIFILGFSGFTVCTILFGKLEDIPLYAPLYRVVWYFTISFFIAMMVPFIEKSKFVNVSLKSIKGLYVFFTWTSILTYAIYLLHMDIYSFTPFHTVLLNTTLHVFLMYGISYLLYVFYEHPFMNLRDELSIKQYATSIKRSINSAISRKNYESRRQFKKY